MNEQLHIRAARPEDKEAVVEFTKTIWDGHDYLPKVWDQWLTDPEGQLHVGELGGQVVATGRIVRLTATQAWMEGLRVDPAFHGRGFARQMHDYAVAAGFALPGVERVGLSTSWRNEAVAHMSRASGMELICDFHFLIAQPERGTAPIPGVAAPTPADLSAIWTLITQSPDFAATQGHFSDGWKFPLLTETFVADLLAAELIVGLRRDGAWAALTLLSPDRGHANPWIGLCVGEQAAISSLGTALRQRSATDKRVRASVPAGSASVGALRAAGYADPEDGEFHAYLFETPPPPPATRP